MKNRTLLLTDDTHDAHRLIQLLDKKNGGEFNIKWYTKLSEGIQHLHESAYDLILVDLLLADSCGLETFNQLFAIATNTPIVILSQEGEESSAEEAVSHGAKANLSKGHFLGEIVPITLKNIIQYQKFEANNYHHKTRAEITLNSISDAVISTNILGQIDYLNTAAEAITGWTKGNGLGQPVEKVFNIINRITRKPPALNPVYMVLEEDEPMSLTPGTLLICKDGKEISIEDSSSPIHDEHGIITGTVVVFHDVTDAVSMTLKMAHLAQHDFLTNLPNRILLNDRISQAITLASRTSTQFALLFLDLDNFKHINDSLGHDIGDKLLQSIAERLTASVRKSDTVSRQGGDEFLILLAEGKFGEDAALTAEKILAEINKPHIIYKHNLVITLSIGISVYPKDGLDAETLIKNADNAMYQAKKNGLNTYQFFTDEMNKTALERLNIETNLKLSLKNHEFMLLYQPKINLVSGKITGVEALLRSRRTELLKISPGKLIKIAEDCGLIVAIGNWVMREACIQAKKWLDYGFQFGTMAINISVLEFQQVNFVDNVKSILAEINLEAHYLTLEITESVLMSNAESSKKILYDLKNIGFKLAMDDFGTGYSSLSYLKQFPLDTIKIDQSFVTDVTHSNDNGIIVSSIVGMGNSLKLKVVAEGIETKEQLAFLKQLDCEEGQGFLFSRPISANEFATIVKNDDIPWIANFESNKKPKTLALNNTT